MKKYSKLLVIILLFASCTNGKLDEGKLDQAGDKLQQKVEEGADSIASKVDRFTDSLGNRRDTIER